jgi:uncharacterized protein YjeT (DUF2065 family)
MADRLLLTLTYLILVLSGILLCSSVLTKYIDLGSLPLEQLQLYGGSTLIALGSILAGANLVVGGHTLYEYWVVVFIGA